MTEKNPYIEMPKDIVEKHLSQIKEVIGDKQINVQQMFGLGVSDEDKEKIEKFDSLTSQVSKLQEASASRELSETESRLAKASIDRLVSDIKVIDENAPLESVLNSKFNNLEKIDMLSGTKDMVKHYADRIEAVKSELTTKTANVEGTAGIRQEFANPEDATADVNKIIGEIQGMYGLKKKEV